MLAVLTNRNFALLWVGQAVSQLGDQILNMALLLWIYGLTNRSPLAVAAIMVCEYAPLLLFGPFAGVLVDRWDRRRVMIASDLIRGGLTVLLVISTATLSPYPAYVIAFAASAMARFFNPARNAILPALVAPEQLLAANALSQVTYNVTLFVGPAIGAAVYSLTGPNAAFILDAATFFFSAATIILIKQARPETGTAPAPGESMGSRAALHGFFDDLTRGLAYVGRNRILLALLVSVGLAYLGGGAINTLEVVLVTGALGLDQSYVAVLASSQGLAMLMASLAVGLTGSRRSGVLSDSYTLFWAGLAACGLATVALGLAPALAMAAVFMFINGIGNAIVNVGFSTLIQLKTDPAYRGRVFSILEPALTICLVISTAIGGWAATMINVRAIFVLCGVIMIGSAALARALAGEGTATVQPAARS